jgi:NMD protein affecting ribosome stability and mRNA decay
VAVSVCLRCGAVNRGGHWFECAACGYAPEDPEGLTRQLLATADRLTPQLKEIARAVKAGQPVEFHPEEVRANWTTREQVLQLVLLGEAMEREECPECGSRLRYVSEGLSCGWACSGCGWSVWTTNPAALAALPSEAAGAEPGGAPDRGGSK